MALLKKLPRLFIWSQGYYPGEISTRSAAAAADTLPRLAWPPQAPSRAHPLTRLPARRRARHPHLVMGFVFLLILLAMLTVYASRGATAAPYIQTHSLAGPAVLQQSGPVAPSAVFWYVSAGQVNAGQVAPICMPVTGE